MCNEPVEVTYILFSVKNYFEIFSSLGAPLFIGGKDIIYFLLPVSQEEIQFFLLQTVLSTNAWSFYLFLVEESSANFTFFAAGFLYKIYVLLR